MKILEPYGRWQKLSAIGAKPVVGISYLILR